MDRVELGIKLEQISRLMDKEDYRAASQVADTVEWRKVKKWSELSIAAEAYERAGRYQEARNMCVHAYNRNLGGKRLIYKLTELSIKLNDLEEADDLYNEYVNAAPNSVDKYILLYKLNKARKVSKERLIDILEQYKSHELDEYYEYELAKLYSELGRVSECIKECDDLVLWFADGEYVEKALRLKQKHAPLTKTQQSKLDMIEECRAAGMEYEYNLPAMDDKSNDENDTPTEAMQTALLEGTEEKTQAEAADSAAEASNEIEVPVQDFSLFDTQNIQAELAKSLEELINGSANDAAEVEAFKAAMPVTDSADKDDVVDIDRVNKDDNVAIKREDEALDEVDEPTKEIRINTHHWKRVVSVMEEPKAAKNEMPKYLVAKDEFEGEIDTDSDIIITEITELFADEEEAPQEAENAGAEVSETEPMDDEGKENEETKAEEVENEEPETEEAESEEAEIEETQTEEPETEEAESENAEIEDAETEEPETEEAESENAEIEDTETEDTEAETTETEDSEKVEPDKTEAAESEEAKAEETKVEAVEPMEDNAEMPDEEFIEGQINIMEWMDSMKDMPPVEGPVYTIPDPEEISANETTSQEELEQAVKETEDEVTRQLMEAVSEDLLEEAANTETEAEEDEPEKVDANDEKAENTDVTEDEPLSDDAAEEAAVSEEELAQAVKETEDEISLQLAQAVNEEINSAKTESTVASEDTSEEEISGEADDNISDEVDEDESEDEVSVEETVNKDEDNSTPEASEQESEDSSEDDEDEEIEADEDEEAASDEEEPLIKDSERKYLNKYLFMQGMETSIIEVLYGKRNEVPDGTSAKGNIVVVGRSKTDKTGFAINLFKAMHVDDEKKTLKIAKTTAAILNRNGIEKVKDKIKGSTLIIEHAGQLNKNVVTELTEFMQGETGSMLVILTGEDFSIKRIFSENREFEELFGYRIEIKHYSVNELVEVAKEYARIQGYTIEEKAMLKVYLKVGDIEGDDNGTDLDAVRILIDDAIKHNEQRGGARFGRKRNGLIALKAKDFGK